MGIWERIVNGGEEGGKGKSKTREKRGEERGKGRGREEWGKREKHTRPSNSD